MPIIYFVNGCAPYLDDYASSGADVLGVDWRVGIDEVRRRVGDGVALQGNLDPGALFASPAGDPRARRRHPRARRRDRSHLQPRPRRAARDRSRARARDGDGGARAVGAGMRIAVVGGGIGGLTAARALVAAGHRRARARGGAARRRRRRDEPRRWLRARARGELVPRRAAATARSRCAASSASRSTRRRRRAKRRWIYIDGKLRALPRSPIELARSDLLTWRGKLALLREPLRAARARGDDESVHAFAARRFGAEAARAIVAPFVTGVFAADAHDVSLEAGFPRLAALDAARRHRARHARSRRAGVVARRGQAQPTTPRGMCAPRGGLGALVDALARELGARVRARTRASRAIAPADRAASLVDGERVRRRGARDPGARTRARSSCAMPELATRLAAFRRAPVALVYLGYPARAVPRAADGFGFLVAQGEDSARARRACSSRRCGPIARPRATCCCAASSAAVAIPTRPRSTTPR